MKTNRKIDKLKNFNKPPERHKKFLKFQNQNLKNHMKYFFIYVVLGIKIGQKDREGNSCKPQSHNSTAKFYKYFYGSHGTYIR